MKKNMMFSVHNSSTLTFAIRLTKIDALLSVVLFGAAGWLAYVWGGETIVVRRVVLALLAAVSTYSTFIIARTLVPFVLPLSFAHMIRLRLSFYLWLVSLVVAAGLCGAAELFSTVSSASVQLTLMLASITFTIRFFQVGSLLRLALAFSCAGGATGFSVFGVLAPVTTLFLMRFMASKMLMSPSLSSWEDTPNPGVVEYFMNPLLRSRAKWLFIGCYIVCCGLSVYYVWRGVGCFSGMRHVWLGCVRLEDVAFLLMTATLPLVVGLAKVGTVLNATERSDFGGLVVYMAIAPITALFMLKPLLIPSQVKQSVCIGANALAFASVFYVFNLLLASTIILADIRCRDFRGVDGVNGDSLRNVMFFIYAIVSIASLFLLAGAVFLFLK